MSRKNINTTIDEDLYMQIRLLAIKLKLNANDLIEEGMRYILDNHKGNEDKA